MKKRFEICLHDDLMGSAICRRVFLREQGGKIFVLILPPIPGGSRLLKGVQISTAHVHTAVHTSHSLFSPFVLS